jgi:hypothetical protein
LVPCECGRHDEKYAAGTLFGGAALLFETKVRHMVMNDWTPKALQQLHHAVTQVDYCSLFAYYGYPVGFLNGGCWLIAKAIQQVAGGALHYVAAKVDPASVGDVVHTVVKLGDDAFMDGRGLHTRAQLLAQCAHLQQNNQIRLSLQPLFFFPNVWERNLAVSEAIAWTITQQLLAQEEASAEPSEPRLEDEDAPPVNCFPALDGVDLASLFDQGDRPPRPVNATEGRVSHLTLLNPSPPVLDW